MDLVQLKKIIKIFEDSKVCSLELEEKEFKIKLSKKSEQAIMVNQAAPLVAPFQPHHTQPIDVPVKKEQSPAEEDEEKASRYHEIRSPIVGTFYRAPSPDAEPYVKIGDSVNNGTVLCIVEAMKLMNEIESDIAGKVVRILVDNGSPVEYNQPLFLIET